MTSETLKPFITPQSVDNFPATHSSMAHRKRCTNLVTIGLSLTGIALLAALLGLTIWSTIRINTLETDVQNLNKVVESMQKRLGLHYLDDLNDFEKEYANALIDNPNTIMDNTNDLDDDDDDTDADADGNVSKTQVDKFDDVVDEDDSDDLDEDDDDDDDEDEYDDLGSYDDYLKKYGGYDDDDFDEDEDDDLSDDNDNNNDNDNDDEDEDEDDNDNADDANISDGDNIYDNFEKFQDSKKKPEANSRRNTRSIQDISNELEQQDDTTTAVPANKTQTSADALIVRSTNGTNQQQQPQQPQQPQLNHTQTHTHRAHKHKRLHKYHFIAENAEGKRSSPLRTRGHRRHKLPVVKSAKSAGYMNAPVLRAAAHYHLNRKVADRHAPINVDSYTGDLYIGHPSWTNEITADNYFSVENGLLTIHEPGLYYVYAQVCYNNTHDQNGFVIFHGHKPFLQCLNTVPTNLPHKIHTCHTSGLIFLKENETIHLRDFHSDRNVILKDTNNRSYFGLIKI